MPMKGLRRNDDAQDANAGIKTNYLSESVEN
jgi:hypothetical protein